MRKWNVQVATVGLLLSLVGCSGYRSYQEAQLAEQTDNWDRAVLKYLELVERDPGNIRYKTGLIRARISASRQHFKRGRELRDAGDLERAVQQLHEAVRLDSTNQYAQAEFEKARDTLIAERAESASPALADLKKKIRGSRPQPPALNPRSLEPISLSFPKPVSIFNIYKALGKAFGINIQFDSKVRDQDVAIELEQVSAQEALEILMRTADHFYKVLNEHTILVAEDTQQNRRKYEDLVIQTFFLSNSEPKQVMQMLRSLVGTKNVAANEPLNAIVMRDTADKVKVAERIIAINDKARGEVVIDVELLQINTSKLQELGVSLSQYNITQTLDPNPVRVSDLEFINQGNWTLSIPSFIYEFVKNSSEAQLLANPQVRISDGEKATFHIGDRVPIPVTTFNTGQTIGGNIVPITSFQYQEVGIRLDIEPRIHHNREITLKLKIEVSDISGTVQGSGGQQQPIIGTRNIESTIRLKDGETNFLAGLYQTNESSSSRGFPGLSEIPIIGRLFSRKSTDVKRTDLVLTLTPHIVRTADITEEDLLPIWVGTEANITFRGRSPRVESEIGGPFEDDEEADAERIREMIRRRIQNLPRGVRGRQREDQDEGEVEEIPGVDLVPSSAPIDPFNSDDDDEDDDNGNGSRNSGRASLAISAASEIDSAGGAEPDAESAKAFEARQDPVRLTLRAPQRAISVGEKFVLELHIDSPVPVSHVPLTLQYDPDMLQVESIRAGDFLGSSNESTVLWDYAKPGRIVIGASRLGRSRGVSGRGTLARIEVIALQRGRTEVKFLKSKVMDADLTPLRQVESETVQLLIEPFNRDPDAEDEAN